MRYHDITKDDMKNGVGLRVVLWLSGCDHKCYNCQNPVTWDPEDGLLFDDKAKAELFEILGRDYIDGITLTGGDPLYRGNREEVTELVKDIRRSFPDKTIWMYTGYDFEDVRELYVIEFIDVLVDGKYIEELRDTSLRWVGSDNQRIIDIKATLLEGSIVLYEKNCKI